jgi:uncharacterized protein YkwD
MAISPELSRTAELVKADYDPTGQSPWRLPRRAATYLGCAILALGFLASPTQTAVHLAGASGYYGELFSLTNQDRASNGVTSLSDSGVLSGIAGATPYHVCGITVDGRSQDMINRDYFAHPIPPCGTYVFTMMQEAGVNYRSAGENIGWEANAADPAAYINTQFMNSPEHRTNILDASYTTLGIGSAVGTNWMGQSSAIMFAEEFAQLSAAPASTPLPPPPPRNSKAPPPPSVTPITTAPVPPPPTTPPPSPTPPVLLDLGPGGPPLIWSSSGLLSDSVESVLEGYFVN